MGKNSVGLPLAGVIANEQGSVETSVDPLHHVLRPWERADQLGGGMEFVDKKILAAAM